MLAHWSRYLVVLLSGYMETSIRHICMQHVESRSAPSVRSFSESALSLGLQNPNSEKIVQLVGLFDSEFRTKLTRFIEGERKEAIDSMVSARNRIAHGEDSGVTMGTAKNWFRLSKEVVTEVAVMMA